MTEPKLTLPAGALPALHRSLAAGRTPAEAAEAARRLGYESGAEFHRAFERWLGGTEAHDLGSLGPDAFWHGLAEFFASEGWGHLSFEELHPGVAALSSTDWAEADSATGASHPACHITTGLLSDLLGRVGSAELAVLEVECRAAGHERCTFLVGGEEALESVYRDLRGGRDYAAAVRALG